jgi:hypothetical protein
VAVWKAQLQQNVTWKIEETAVAQQQVDFYRPIA